MTFNDRAGLDTSQVRSGGRGRRAPMAIGGGAGGLIVVVFLIIQALSGGGGGGTGGGAGAFDLDQITQQGQGDGLEGPGFSECQDGADANRDDTCRVIGTVNSVQDYWSEALGQDTRADYREAVTVIYSGTTDSACGTASSEVGPFYCPVDEQVYIDVSFFDELSSRFGADGGNLAQMYVVAHEYGHHVQHILDLLGESQRDREGPESGAVRIELMADCLAGVWANHAATTEDEDGVTLIKPLTRTDIQSALSAAEAVGDDRIQRSAGGQVNPEVWTHGSSDQRRRWFIEGYETGNINQCNTLRADRL